MKRVLLCLLALLLLAGCGETPATIELPGEGYRALAEVDGTCYLVENSGIIYTLDWDTGKTTVYYKPPVDIAWAADPDMTHIYYMDGADLHRVDIAADRDAVLCELPDTLDLLTVTDHYLIYRHGLQKNQDGYYTEYDFCSLHLETLERTLLENETFDGFSAVFTQGDTVFWVQPRTDELGVAQGSDLQSFDLASGECTVLDAGDDDAPYLLALANGILYYRSGWEDYPDFLAVPADGSGEPRPLSFSQTIPGYSIALSQDAKLLAVSDPDRGLVLYRYDSAADTAVEISRMESMTIVHCAVTNGSRYALLASGSRTKLVLGDLG